jgi:hypothetical protein
MALYKVTAHPCVCSYSTLEVHWTAFFQAAQICPPQSLGCDADLELVFAELGHSKAGTVDTDAVAEMYVAEDIGAARNGQAGAAAAA